MFEASGWPVGRKSREKEERRERGNGRVAKLLADYSTESLLPLIEAASVSPTAAHRAPTLALLFEAVMHRRRAGTEQIAAEALPKVAEGVASVHPKLFHREDFQPYDGRQDVLVPWGDQLFRMLPGAMERPTQVVRQHKLLASVIDPFITDHLGFGLRDVGELILQRVNQVARALAPSWPDGPLAAIGDEATVTDAEVAAAVSVGPIETLIKQCTNPSAARRALEHYTTASADLAADAYSLFTPSTFGTTIAVAHRTSTVALPAGLLPEALTAIGVELAALAAKINPQAETDWYHSVGNQIGQLFQGTGHRIAGPVRVGTGAPIHSLVWFDDRRILVVGNGSSLKPADRQERLNASAKQVQRVRPGATVDSPRGTLHIPDNAHVLHVQVMAGPQYSGPLELMFPTIGLDDLEWVIYSEAADRDDLWYFIRDLTHTPGVREQLAWDMIDRWEFWRPSKSFYRGTKPVDLMAFAAHAAVAEWEDAARAAPIEMALHRLGLRPLRDWPCIELEVDGTDVGDLRTDEMIHVLPFDVPVGVDRIDTTAPAIHAETLWRLSIGLDWKLTKTRPEFVSAAERSGLGAVRIQFAFKDRDDGPAFTTVEADDRGRLTIGWDARLQTLLAANSFAVEENLGRVVAQVFSPLHRDDFITAWDAAPPGIRADGFDLHQQARGLAKPFNAHKSLGVDVLRQLAAALETDGVEPGQYAGADGTALESTRVFPWLIARLHETIAPFSADDLLYFAMVQLECASNQSLILDRRVGWERGFPVAGNRNTATRLEDASKATRVMVLILEEVLARPPSGDKPVDPTSWAEILVVAELCIESCFRSEVIHRRLQGTVVDVSDMFEITIRSTHNPTDVDMTAYTAARVAATMPAAVPITTDQHLDPDPDDVEPRSTVGLLPELADIDAALRRTLSFGIDALTGVLNVGTQWDATDAAPVTRATRDEIANACIELTAGATREEYLAALDWLTLRSRDLQMETIPHWETERRARRVAVCPYIEAGDECVWVLPWTVETSMRIFANYVGDGRLPWPGTALPAEVRAALGAYRQGKNDQLEDDIEDALRKYGFEVRGSVKPEKKDHYGLASLSGEIDTLCIDEPRSRIWVIEAKDPFIAWSARQIRRQIDDFHKSNGYVDALLRKVADVSASASDVAAALKVDEPRRTWEVVGMAVTRRVDPGAFAVNPRIPFCVADDVVQVVDRDATPGPGFHETAA
jgi:hypothetical protein